MKKSTMAVTLLCLLVPIILIVIGNSSNLSRERAFYVLQGMKGSPDTKTRTGDPINSLFTPNVNAFGNSIAPVIFPGSGTETMSLPGFSGYGLDVMYLMSHVDAKSAEALRNKELISMYYAAAAGELDDAAYRLEASVYAAMHENESGRTTFIDDIYMAESGGYSAQDITLAYYTTEIHKALGRWKLGKSYGGVYYDSNNDGYPDGPFQIILGDPTSHGDKKAKINAKGQTSNRGFDIIYFPDNLAQINYTFSYNVNSLNATFKDTREKGILASIIHNRGSAHFQAWGTPYHVGTKTLSGGAVNYSFSDYVRVGSTSAETWKEIQRLATDLFAAYDSSNIVLKGFDNPNMRILGCVLLLKQGWYIEDIRNIPGLSGGSDSAAWETYFAQVFPEVNLNGSSAVNYIKTNFVKKPWDIATSLGFPMTKADYGKIYGMKVESYYNYYYYGSLFKVENYTSDFYANKLSNGNSSPVIHVWDNVTIGHVTGSAFIGESLLLEMFIKAGVQKEIDGVTIDPTNPTNVYKLRAQANPNSWNPSVVDESLQGLFNQVLTNLGLSPGGTLPYGRYLTLYYQYEQAGTKYWYGGGGYPIAASSYPIHKDWASNKVNKGSFNELNSYHYRDKDNSPYIDGSTKDYDLYFGGKRLFDCCMFSMSGLSLGATSNNGKQMYYALSTSGAIKRANNPLPADSKLLAANGVVYDATLTIASNGRHTLQEYLNNPSLVPGGLQPGDVLCSDEAVLDSGEKLSPHAFTFVCLAQKDVVLVAELVRGDRDLTVKVGDVVALEAWDSGEYNRLCIHNPKDPNKYYVIRTPMQDSTTKLEMPSKTIIKGVTYIGDSIANAMRSYIPDALGLDSTMVDIEAANGKFLCRDGNGNNPSGLSIYTKLKETSKLREVLVIALGSNAGSKDVEAIESIMTDLPSGIKVVLVTPWCTEESGFTYGGKSSAIVLDTTAQGMRQLAAKFAFVEIADWNQYCHEQINTNGKQTADIAKDGIHPNSAMYDKYLGLVAAAVNNSALQPK